MKHTILIVDDIASNIQSLAAILKDKYQIKVANSGIRALEILSLDTTIDLILLDIEMPDMNGYEVLTHLQLNHKTKDIPVIFITGNISVQDEEKGLCAGAVDYITKPLHPGIIKARVKTHITLKEQRDKLQYNAVHDKLTGLYNRHQLDTEGLRKFTRASRQNSNLSAIMIDIDHFKNINDTYGHLVGDNVLKELSNILKQNKRIEDFVVRYGGEEFIILLEECNSYDAEIKAQKLRKLIEELNPTNIKVTASFGVATLNKTHKTLEELLKDADKALYESKETGRNKVSIAS